VLQSGSNIGRSGGAGGFDIGRDSDALYPFDGELAILACWKRVLSDAVARKLTYDTWDTVFRNPDLDVTLRAFAAGTTDIELAWTDNAESETGFELQRTDDGGTTWDDVTDTIAADAESYTDSGVTTGQTYQYRLRALNATKGDSEWVYSNEVTV
jgi:hypothetical protein